MDPHYTYLLLNFGSIIAPLALSFDKKVAFYKKWKAFFPANLIMLTFFVIWDVFFTKDGIWGFNPDYLSGPSLLGLPIEEWLFFICIPYASIFLYESLRCWIPGEPFKKWGRPGLVIMAMLTLALTISFPDRLYTFFTCLFTFLGILALRFKEKKWLGWFFFSYIIILIPFVIVNGFLTGINFWEYPLLNFEVDAIPEQVVWYNNLHNLRVRLFSVPLDDTIYGMLMIGMNIGIYEHLMDRYQLR